MSGDATTKITLISSITGTSSAMGYQAGVLDYGGLIIGALSLLVAVVTLGWRVYNDLHTNKMSSELVQRLKDENERLRRKAAKVYKNTDSDD